ncbi:uncharacterized protein RB166_004098 [Leptodactylus fuscus]|uniref:uncharacterized protein LOC142197044 isoform X1 n=1 Tax=Leptodactylus fuscus TaxID=238119 RepID=UPI003F4E5011
MPSCLIKGCFNTWKQKESKVILHVFPKDKEGIRLWLIQSPENFPNVDELVEKIYSQNKYGTVRLCSKHFNDDQYFHEGTRRRLRPNAVPTIFIAERSPSEKIPRKKGTKRKKSAANSELSGNDGTGEGASSSVLFYPPGDGEHGFVQQVLPSHLQIVIPSTSLLAMEKPKMFDKAINTDMFFSKKCQAVGTDPNFGKKNSSVQTKPQKGKSQGTLCTILMTDYSKSNQGSSQHRAWQTGMGTMDYTSFPRTSQGVMGQSAGNKILPNQSSHKSEFVNHTAMFRNDGSNPNPTSRLDGQPLAIPHIKVESPERSITPSDYGHSLKSNQGSQISGLNDNSTDVRPEDLLVIVKKEDSDSEDSESGSSTDDSEKDDSSTKSTSDHPEGHCDDPETGEQFMVLKSCFYDLIKLIRCQYRGSCHAALTNVQVKTLGTVVAIDVLCSKGHNSTLWHSQPMQKNNEEKNPVPARGGPPQPLESSDIKTFFHNLEYDDEDLPK